MPRVVLVAGRRPVLDLPDHDILVAVDRACLHLVEAGYQLDLAVGDFDSVTAAELELIRRHSQTFQLAPAEKNDTDTELALQLLFQRFPDAQVIICGAFGGRLDHELSNLFLPSHPELAPYMRQMTLIDAQNQVTFYPAGEHQLRPSGCMTYISFLLEGRGQLTIKGAKYPLNQENYFPRKIYSSNEFVGQPISVTVPDGYLVVLETKDK